MRGVKGRMKKATELQQSERPSLFFLWRCTETQFLTQTGVGALLDFLSTLMVWEDGTGCYQVAALCPVYFG